MMRKGRWSRHGGGCGASRCRAVVSIVHVSLHSPHLISRVPNNSSCCFSRRIAAESVLLAPPLPPPPPLPPLAAVTTPVLPARRMLGSRTASAGREGASPSGCGLRERLWERAPEGAGRLQQTDMCCCAAWGSEPIFRADYRRLHRRQAPRRACSLAMIACQTAVFEMIGHCVCRRVLLCHPCHRCRRHRRSAGASMQGSSRNGTPRL